MFTQVRFGPWTLAVDPDATRAILASPGYPLGAEGCGCSTCMNFVAQRASLYSPAVRALFASLGVDWRLEVEVVHYLTAEPGRHLYSAWFHAVGRIEEGPEAWTGDEHSSTWDAASATELDGCSIGFSSMRTLAHSAFDGLPVVQLDLYVDLPWVLEGEPEPT